MAINLQALKDEITQNTTSLGYAPFTDGNDVANAKVINSKTRTVTKATVRSDTFVSQIPFAVYDRLSDSVKGYLSFIAARDDIVITDDFLANVAGVRGSSKWDASDRVAMEAKMTALMNVPGSRAEELKATLGVTVVSPRDVRAARFLK